MSNIVWQPTPNKYFQTETKKEEPNMVNTIRYARKPFYVDAVQVTAENMEEVAKWCQGEIRTFETAPSELGSRKNNYIKVRVHRPATERQTKAFVGDWVLYAGTGYKVYTPKAFDKDFVQVDQPIPELDQMLEKEASNA